tara:strand:+ start:341 stop:682 length:342 start_codon:yes stop_codon:yes gene_type:complete
MRFDSETNYHHVAVTKRDGIISLFVTEKMMPSIDSDFMRNFKTSLEELRELFEDIGPTTLMWGVENIELHINTEELPEENNLKAIEVVEYAASIIDRRISFELNWKNPVMFST